MTDLTFTTTLCKSTGEHIEDLSEIQGRRLVQQLNLPAAYVFDYGIYSDNYPAALIDSQPRVKVWRPSTDVELASDPLTVRQLVFYGDLPSEGSDEDADAANAALTFQEPQWKLSDRFVTNDVLFTGIDQGSILWQLIALQNARPNGETWMRQGNTATGVLRDRPYIAGKNVAAIVDEMTKVDGGCDVGFTPLDYYSVDGTRAMGTFNAYLKRGVDRPLVMFVYASSLTEGLQGGLKTNVANMKRRRSKVLTSATSVGTDGINQTYQNIGSPFGLVEEYEVYSDIATPQVLLDKSVGKVISRQTAPMIIDIISPTSEAPQPFFDYNIGDIVYVTCRAGGMSFTKLAVRVMGIDISIDQNGKLETRLVVATEPAYVNEVYFTPGQLGFINH